MTKSNESGVIPIDLKCLVKPIKIEEVTKGGIYIPDPQRQTEDLAGIKAELVAVGSQAFEAIKNPDARPRAGMLVSISKYAGYLITGRDGEEYRLINDDDVVAVLDGDWDVRAKK